MEIDLDLLLKNAVEWAQLGGNHTLSYFRKTFEIVEKQDHSPVTIADRETELLLRKKIEETYPTHGIIGEEYGIKVGTEAITWVLDPIDGTKSFIHGVPLYTTLIGVLIENKPIIGVIYAPATQEIAYACKGKGAYYNHELTHVRPCSDLAQATFLTTELSFIRSEGYGEFFEAVHDSCKIHRTWGDAYGHMKVAAGQADFMFDPLLNIWDAAALAPIIEEAGGIFSDTKGKFTIHTGNGFSCSPQLYPQIIALLEKHKK